MTVFQLEQVRIAVWDSVFQLEQVRIAVWDSVDTKCWARTAALVVAAQLLGERGWNQLLELRVAVDRAMDQNLILGQANDDIRSRQ